MRVISIPTQTHGRVLIRDASGASAAKRYLIGFHGYAQSAEDMLSELELIPDCESWTLVSVQALHRFYSRRHERVVASWMTRQDRDEAIADNVDYVNRAVANVVEHPQHARIVFIGFSQGVAMAYRAALLGANRCERIIVIGGNVPPEMKTAPTDRFTPILLAAGQNDDLYPEEMLKADESFLRTVAPSLEVFRYAGGHEWTAELRQRIHLELQKVP